MRRYLAYRDAPSQETYERFMQSWAKGLRLLDLSEVPPAGRYEVGAEARRLLWEVMARVKLPNPQDIPTWVEPQACEGDCAPPSRWRLPGTEITIVRVEDGPRAGEYLFSPDTVARARGFYETVAHLPHLRPAPFGDLVRAGELFTGWMIPPAWVEALPDWANKAFLGLVLWKWLALLLLFGSVGGVVYLLLGWSRNSLWDGSLASYLRRLAAPLTLLVLVPVMQHLSRVQINVSGRAAQFPDYLLTIARGAAIVWAVWLTVSWIAEAIIRSPRISAKSLDAHLIRLAARSVGVLALLALIFSYAHAIGIPVYGLVAGAGVSGIAVALAAKNTLENLVGAIDLFADRPVRVGDLCRFDEESNPGWRPVGCVESIGLRSTRIRRFDRSLITIPNGKFAQMNIVNLSTCDRFLMFTTLGLRYETSPDQLRFVLGELRALLHAHPETLHSAAEPIRVRFIGYGEYALNISIRAYLRTTQYDNFLAVQEDILLRIGEIVEQAGTAFAFPSQTIYRGDDTGLDTEQQERAEATVRKWSAEHALPFPDIPDARRREISNTLDYPPEGSPGADGFGSRA
jgi:MscS family membrane protein